MYGAFKADPHNMFYQDNHENWQILNEIREDVPIKNPEKYKKELETTLQGIVLGSAIFSKKNEAT